MLHPATPQDLPHERVRIVIIPADGIRAPIERVFAQPVIRVGRPDPANPGQAPELNLHPDMTVSREHATILRQGARWLVEDQRSKHGTALNGKQIQGAGAVEIPFGALIRTGDSLWTLIPEDWWSVPFDSVLIVAPCARVLNYASYHCGMPIMPRLVAINTARSVSRPFMLRLQVSGLSTPVDIRVAPLEPEMSREIAVPALAFDTASLRAQIEPIRASIRLDYEAKLGVEPSVDTLGGRGALPQYPPDATPLRLRGERELTVLGFWDWPYDSASRRTIAAFVTPRNPAVERIINEAQAKPGARAFRELLRTGAPDAELEILRSLYDFLATQRCIHYEDPKLKSGVALTPYQSIRSPHRIFHGDNPRDPGRATCIDLAVLFAACLEHVGLCPLIIFSGAADIAPRHALVGVWVGSTPGGQPVIDDQAMLIREIRSGRMHTVEGTGVTLDVGGGKPRLAFADAVAQAAALIERAAWVSAVDVLALRPPHGTITPLENAYEPEVARIYDECRRLATVQGARHVETGHLFCAIITAGGEITDRLFSRMNLNLAEMRAAVRGPELAREGILRVVATQNVLETQQLAFNFARDAGSPSVREQDLLWAVMQKAPLSPKLQDLLRKLQIDLARMRELLADEFPSPLLAATGVFANERLGQAE